MSEDRTPKQINCDDWQDWIPAYAMGITDSDENAEVEAALNDCPELHDELAGYQDLADAMLFAVPQLEPPPHLRDALQRAAAPAATNQEPSLSLWTRLIQWLNRPPIIRWSPALAALTLILLVASNVYWVNTVNTLRDENTTLVRQLEGDPVDLLRPLGAGGFHRVETTSENETDQRGVLAWVTGNTEDTWVAWMVARELPSLPEDNIYQVWLTREGEPPISLGLMTVDDEGTGSIAFEINEPVGSFDSFGITIEPSGGSSTPTSDPVIAGEITRET